MADFGGPEKDQVPEPSSGSHLTQQRSNDLMEDLEKNVHTLASFPAHTSHSNSSHESIDTDPPSPLERALTATDLATEPEQEICQPLTYTRTGASLATTGSQIPAFEVDFAENDPDNPLTWPLWYRSMVITAVSYGTWTVVLFSTSYTSSIPGMMEEFEVESRLVATMGFTTYLLGMGVGGLVLAPMSEMYGRRIVYNLSLAFFSLLVLPCALARSLSVITVVRFMSAFAGSAMTANSPGTVNDVVTEDHRALAFSIWSIAPMNGPVTGPLIGGFVAQYLGWRWTNWLVLILAGAGWIWCSLMRETYAPLILQRKAAKMRKETGDERWWSRYDQKLSVFEVLKTNLSRPFVLAVTEPILWFWNAYIGFIYGVLYMCFVAYPIVYTDLRGWSLGMTGLGFVGIGIGTMFAICTEPLARRIVNSHPKDPETGRVYPEASISIVCFASILCPIGQLWFSWTSVPITIHWIWPILAGIPFGAGNTLVFIYASNYIIGSYGIYAASALSGNSITRAMVGATLPLAGPKMFAALTPQWAGTLLGLVQVVMIPIPFVFYKWGDRIRARSPLIKQMREDQERIARKVEVAATKGRKKNVAPTTGQVWVVEEERQVNDEEEGGGVSCAGVIGAEKN
ncbi:major facilitator superfamily transporter [Drepanopeziza brunnea f. sp. 'multigermtubi' MB_m1]|uniref:Major facilitator superfamily transporter n=1 Tax=Marssonina brunnea f. sp. multigermtubi (strain MB_m1) TaxID=1072389 RepID=K1XIR1_MARBU|nr:major facilitator superfamily transporter [Drepanopeziza brunnea f. sp. 'multigermtubi' MB_m1]EKD12369.1 major facilitator superfamily transporter [Drepanopeziza brunnea f. sp. 'multigermtubi' MB_m1]